MTPEEKLAELKKHEGNTVTAKHFAAEVGGSDWLVEGTLRIEDWSDPEELDTIDFEVVAPNNSFSCFKLEHIHKIEMGAGFPQIILEK